MSKEVMKASRLLWLDLEMTGLEPGKDKILEVAALVTDWDFKVLAEFEYVVHQSEKVLAGMNEWCVAQHGASGLTERVRHSTLSNRAAEDKLVEFIKAHFDAKVPVLLAGNSIHMDRRFIEAQWPKVAALLHYRMLDVSAWKVVFEGKYGKKFAKPEAHRALEDIKGSVYELKYYLGKVKL